MDSKNVAQISNLINQLNNLFIYNNEQLIYNDKTQKKVNDLLTQIAEGTKTFDKNIKNEKENIHKNLTITDSKTNKRVSLIDIDSMEERVKNVLQSNNIFSCLKSLALCNKCAHSFDGNIQSIQNDFKKYYKELFGVPVDEKKLTFFQPLNVNFPEIDTTNLIDLSNVSDNDFERIYNVISSNQGKIKPGTKISILRQLNIPVNAKDQSDVEKKYQEVVNNKDALINSYLVKKYQEGVEQTELQNTMFSIKDNYISMIGQLLTKEVFSNVEYELIKTPDAKPGFEYMLVINDKDLSYYIEVHMPTIIAKSLIKEYGLIESNKRNKTIASGAPAVYCRDESEIKRIRQALAKGEISSKHASIIARDGWEDEPPINGTTYKFITNQIAREPLGFETFLKSRNIHTKEILRSNRLRSNENYSQNEVEQLICENYYYIYENLNDDDKTLYIFNELVTIRDGDMFDKALFKQITYFGIDMDIIARLLINKKMMKQEYFDKNAKLIEKQLLDEKFTHENMHNNMEKFLLENKKDSLEKSINEFIDSKIIYEINKEIYNDKSKYKR